MRYLSFCLISTYAARRYAIYAAVPSLEHPPVDHEFEALAFLSDLPEGTVLQRVRSTGEAVCLIRHRDQVSAVSDICTHQHFLMSHGELLDDGSIQCAWHGARFDCRTGEVKQGPAIAPLPIYAVRMEGDAVLVGPRAERIGAKYSTAAAKVE